MMMTWSSGRDGWKGYRISGGYINFTCSNKEKLIQVMKKETEYRLNEYYQRAYSLNDSIEWAEKVTTALQLRALGRVRNSTI